MKENNGNGASGGLQFDEEMCERYIFGELSAADQELFEETYFSDDAFFERYLAVKTELLDLLARGELSPDKQARMEPHFQETAPRRRRVQDSALFTLSVTEIAQKRAEKAVVAAPPTEKAGLIAGLIRSMRAFFSSPQFAAVAVLLLAVAAGLYFLNSRSISDGGPEVASSLPEAPQSRSEQPAETVFESAVKEDAVVYKPASPAVALSSRTVEKRRNSVGRRLPAQEALVIGLPNEQKMTPSPVPSPPVSERSATGFALTTSPIPRDNGQNIGPSLSAGLNIGGPRGRQSSPSENLTLSIILFPGTTRNGGQTNTLVLRSGVDGNAVSIVLKFRGELHPHYEVTISNMRGNIVLKDEGFEVAKDENGLNMIAIWIFDTTAFKEANKDYIVTLQGGTKAGVLETIEEYYFHIRRTSAKPVPNNNELLAAELSGQVLGPNGEPVAKATVTAKNVTTGLTRNIMSSEDGTYRMAQLPPGNYEIAAEATTLKRAVINDVNLNPDSRYELPINMQTGGEDAIVNVAGSDAISPRVSIILDPMFTAGSKGVKTIELHSDSQIADFSLTVPKTTHSDFKVTLKTVSGKSIVSRTLRKSPVLTFSVRSKKLSSGDHIIVLRGRSKNGRFQPVAEFYFHVKKSN